MKSYFGYLSQDARHDVLGIRKPFGLSAQESAPAPKLNLPSEIIYQSDYTRNGIWWEKIKQMDEKVDIFVDSGAPSIYNLLTNPNADDRSRHSPMGRTLKDRKDDDFSFLEDPRYAEYRRRYVMFLKKYMPYINVYANLDVINNAEATWENQQYMEQRGLAPIPVWHYGTDVKWLIMYLDKGYEYIAIGGLVPNPNSVLIPALDEIWGEYLTDEYGMPNVKVHGFAVTSPSLMIRYPWWSVDSTSWVKYGKFGIICVPVKKRGKYDYSRSPHKVAVSNRSTARTDEGKHISTYSRAERNAILRYLAEHGVKLGHSTFKKVGSGYELKDGERFVGGKKGDEERKVEMIDEWGVCNDYKLRDQMNILYYRELEKAQPPWPWAFDKGKKTGRLNLF